MSDPLGPELTLDEYQRRAAETDIEVDGKDPIVPLLGLVGEAGNLVTELKKKTRPDGVPYGGFEGVVREEMGDVLWYLAALARRVGVGLGDVAEANLRKTKARWIGDPDRHRLAFDADFGAAEQLPRRFEVKFSTHVDEAGRTYSQMTILGEEIGDPIEDNSRDEDHYRFHDVFHVAHAAVLGWSPILRSLLERKRKADEEIDRAEDGARAGVTEEAVASLVFNLARSYDFFEGAEHVDDTILEAVMAITSNLEVQAATAFDWEQAILSGYRVWRRLRDTDGGTVAVDLDRGSLELV